MYARFKYGCPPPPKLIPTPLTPAPLPAPPTAPILLESERMASQVCATAWVTSPAAPASYDTIGAGIVLNNMSGVQIECQTSIPWTGSTQPTQRIQVPVIPSQGPPVVVLGSQPASVALQQKTAVRRLMESDPFNPTTRFAQYFPPAPVPAPCVVRLPNTNPPVPLIPCIPPTRFQGSTVE